MTENEKLVRDETEAIECLKSNKPTSGYLMLQESIDMAIKALEELQQYRAIGTPEECRKSVSICKAMIERKLTPENMEEYMKFEDECVKRGFTFSSLLEAREKQTAKKPMTYERTNRADCPVCGATVRGINKPFGSWCSYCGQKLDWSVEE